LRCKIKLGRGTVIKSVFDYRFYSNKLTHMFLFVTQAFWVFILRMCFFVCNVGLFAIIELEPKKHGDVWLNSFKPLKSGEC